ncbi:hypothetical protein CN980_28970 [Bacillus cereus]|uniref:Uncharacterized protein n=1 Tax=Bacillus cereus TaxID=1396 RepID=A0A9X7C5Z5_BACCE|nr:hypothetical protein [Bacillus cereus]PGO61764.1 hypothetical protein CN980_28970 [Bacillus cereus]
MKELLKDNRAFSREIVEKYYLILPSDRLVKSMNLSYRVLIKKGDLPYPNRWINFMSQDEINGLVPLTEFNEDDYDYIFVNESLLVDELNTALIPFGITVDYKLKNLLDLVEISEEIQSKIKVILDEWNDIGELELEKCEVMHYINKGEKEFVRIQEDCSTHDIDYEDTKYLTAQTIVATYIRETARHTEYLHKTNENRWFIVKPSHEPFVLFIIEEIWDIEDMIPFTTFKPA